MCLRPDRGYGLSREPLWAAAVTMRTRVPSCWCVMPIRSVNRAAATRFSVPRGLAGVIVTDTRIGDVRGLEGFYHYRQYSAVELAQTRGFEDVWHLFANGALKAPARGVATRTPTVCRDAPKCCSIRGCNSRSRRGTRLCGVGKTGRARRRDDVRPILPPPGT